ncbi:unnamed protein product, partial [Allacma fusca]
TLEFAELIIIQVHLLGDSGEGGLIKIEFMR